MSEIPGKNITLEQLEEMFTNISNGTDWDVSSPLLWGYFFTHNEPSKLEQVKDKLINQGYTFVDIYLSDKEDSNGPDLYWLHIEKVEAHTPKTLDDRNNEFYTFAHQNGLDSYDGMDVGPASR